MPQEDHSDRLLRYFRNVFYQDRGKRVSRVQLVRCSGELDRPVADWPIKEQAAMKEERIQELISEIIDHAQSDCDTCIDSTGTYQVLSYLADMKSTDLRSSPIRLRSQGVIQRYDGKGGESGPPVANDKDVLVHVVKQNTRYAELLVSNQSIMHQHYEGLLKMLVQRNIVLEEKRDENIQLYEELQSEKHRRELEAMKAERNAKIQKEALEKFSILLPTVLNHVMGKKVLPEVTTPVIESIRQFVKTLTPDQIQGMNLDPAQTAALGSVMKVFIKDEEEEQEKEKEPNNNVKQFKDSN